MTDFIGPAKPQKRKIEEISTKNENEPPNESNIEKLQIQPKKKQKSRYFELLRNLPSRPVYEWSYSHSGELSHLFTNSETEFVISVSINGFIKFWKRSFEKIEFVKCFRPCKTRILCANVSSDGKYFCIGCQNEKIFNIKVFDIVNVVIFNIVELSFEPSQIVVFKDDKKENKIIVSEKGKNSLYVFDISDFGDKKNMKKIDKFHKNNIVNILQFNSVYNVFISADEKGFVEYYGVDFEFPKDVVDFKFKSETDLFEFAKNKTYPISLEFNKSGNNFVCMGKDRFIRIFNFLSGKLLRKIDETISRMKLVQQSNEDKYSLHGLDFGKRVEIEKLFDNTLECPPSNAIFDESGMFIIYPTALGIKIVNLITNKVERLLGKHEHNNRFTNVCLFQGKPKIDRNRLANMDNYKRKYSLIGENMKINLELDLDPMIFCCSFKKNRFYVFSDRLFDEDFLKQGMTRDVIDESDYNLEDDLGNQVGAKSKRVQLPRYAIIHTHFGDIKLKLYPEECPITIENFVGLSRSGYYNGILFHRVIKNFMIQTGDPKGDGTGGNSMWGGNFKDEISSKFSFKKPFKLAMANTGDPNTNGSQFFITTTETPWLEGKHTLFGEVIEGKETVLKIENVKVSKYEKPLDDVIIISITLIDPQVEKDDD